MTIGDSLGPEGKRPKLYGVGGWLAFLCVSLVLLTPMAALMRVVGILRNRNGEPFELIFEAVFVVTIAAFAMVTGVGLVQIWRKALRLAKVYLFVNLALGLLDTIALAEVGGFSLAQSVYQNVVITAWIAYLYRSERVRNTYARGTAQEAAEVFR